MGSLHDLVLHLQSLEEDLMRPEVRSSRVELEARLAADFAEIGRSGRVYDRASLVEALATEGDHAPPVIHVRDFSVRLLAPDIALATYRSVLEDPVGGPPAVALRSSIWRREGDAWRMAFHQWTPAG
jgi:hypothetical protein